MSKASDAMRLRGAIRTLGVSVTETAVMFDVNRDTVHTWLRGEGAVPSDAPERMAAVMSDRVTRLLRGDFDDEDDGGECPDA